VRAEVDLNVVVAGAGQFVEVQGTGEHGTFDRAALDRMLDAATHACEQLDQAQARALAR
jgi:ribonuclease PH